jgi:predicted PurR-regulated permease PerM
MNPMSTKIEKNINISITSGSVVRILFILLLAYFAFVLRDLVLVILTSVVIASGVEPITKWLMRRRVPRALAVVMIYLSAMGLLGFLLVSFVPPLINDTKDIVSIIPQYIESISESEINQLPVISMLVDQFNSTLQNQDLFNQIATYSGKATLGFVATATAIFGGLLSFILIVVISFYLAVQEGGIESFLRLVTPIQKEKYVIDLWKRSQRKIGLWMQGQLLLGIIVGVLTFLGLSILGVKNAFFLAVLAGVFELIPIFGPIISAIPAVGMALIQDGVVFSLLVLGLFLIIQQFENHLIHPLVVKKIIGIPALVAILALIIGAQIAGFLGMIIAVPITAALMEYLSDVEKAKLEEMRKLSEN